MSRGHPSISFNEFNVVEHFINQKLSGKNLNAANRPPVVKDNETVRGPRPLSSSLPLTGEPRGLIRDGNEDSPALSGPMQELSGPMQELSGPMQELSGPM